MTNLVYFSSVSGNTERFIERLGRPAARIPLMRATTRCTLRNPTFWSLPTYGGGDGHGAVPKQVIKFLNDEHNRSLLRGVIAAGNTNFGRPTASPATSSPRSARLPLLYRFEVFGTPDDVRAVNEGLDAFW